MNLPRAVREQAERAEAAHAALLTGNTAPAAPVVDEAAPQAEVIVETVTPAAPVVVAPVAEQLVEPVTDSWELKYKVLNGKYQAEVPRLAQQLREVSEQLRDAKNAPAAAQAAEVPANGMTPDSVAAQYGEDFAAAVDAIAEAKTKKLRDELSSTVGALAEDTAARSRGDFIRDLTGLVRNWEAIDREPGFTAYLDEVDTQTGRARREFFNEADRTNNAARTASFFAAYAKGSIPAHTPKVVEPAPSVEHLISPDSSRSSEAPPGKKLWTRVEVAKFYADARAQGGSKPYGRFTAAEYERIDSDINAAIGEGRYGA